MDDLSDIIDLLAKLAVLFSVIWKVGKWMVGFASVRIPQLREIGTRWIAITRRRLPSRLVRRVWQDQAEALREFLALREPIRSILGAYFVLFAVAIIWDILAHPTDPPEAIRVSAGLGFAFLIILACIAGAKRSSPKLMAYLKRQ